MKSCQLDVKNMLCPLPVIRTQDKVRSLEHGDRLTVLCTDPGAKSDIPAWCRVHNHRLLSVETMDDVIIIGIEVVKETSNGVPK